jgi:hypothetical protein
MRWFSVIFLTFLYCTDLACADPTETISAAEAAKHVGEVVTVQDEVVSIHRSGKGNTFLNFGGDYRSQVFTGWIPAGSSAQSSPLLKEIEESADHRSNSALQGQARDSDRFGKTDSGFTIIVNVPCSCRDLLYKDRKNSA